MALLLAIETTTKNCSVALFDNSILLKCKEQQPNEYSHAEQLTIFIEEVLDTTNTSFKEIDGIILSKGPGSYTGLRIGTSTAKGLCYALNIPLVAVPTLKSMAFSMSNKKEYKFYCPMIDARRMEVFAAIYDRMNNEAREIRADIVAKDTYNQFLKEDKVLFFGDGALKCKEVINHSNAFFIDGVFPSAKDFGKLGFKKFANKDYEDIAYFEPFYLKDFVVGKKKKT